MKKTKVKRKINIIKLIESIMLLGAGATSLLYIAYITILSLYNYLHNRPIRTAFIMVAISVIMMLIDTIQENKSRAKARAKARQDRARQTQTQTEQSRQSRGGAIYGRV